MKEQLYMFVDNKAKFIGPKENRFKVGDILVKSAEGIYGRPGEAARLCFDYRVIKIEEDNLSKLLNAVALRRKKVHYYSMLLH